MRITGRFGLGLSVLSLLLLCRGASAKVGGPCESDAECDEGFLCKRALEGADGGVGVTASSGIEVAGDGGVSLSEEAEPQASRETRGECLPDLDPCTSDADCSSGYICKHHGVSVASMSCDSDGNCTTSESKPLDPESLYCTPTELTCESDADCPEPAVCITGECVWEMHACAADSDCESRYVCSANVDRQKCEGQEVDTPTPIGDTLSADGGAVPEGEGTKGEGTSEDESSTGEFDACEPFRMCFPPPKACEADTDCEGWVCFALPEGGNPPLGWEGIEKACMPPGIALAISRRIEIGGDVPGKAETDSSSFGLDEARGEVASSGSEADAAVSDGEPGSKAADEDESDAANEDKTESEAVDADDGGCNLAVSQRGSVSWFAALLSTGVAGLLCRRRTRTSAS